MASATVPKQEIGGDLVRVHRAITRAVGVAREHGTAYLAAGYPDAGTRDGYLTYVRCLACLLHAHHTTEDERMFPHLRPMLPDAPYDALMAQHGAMVPVLDEIEAAVAVSSDPDRALNALSGALARIDELWRIHIALEEAHFGPDGVGAALTMAERKRAGRATRNHAVQHQRPFILMLAFILYNMSPGDRAVMSQPVPGLIHLLLLAWKPAWRAIAPFLLVDA